MLDDLREQTVLVSAAAWQQPSWRQEAEEHRAILAAAEAGDAAEAGRLLAAHIASFAGACPDSRDPRGTEPAAG